MLYNDHKICKSDTTVHISCEKSGGLHQAKLGLMVGWQAGWLADQILGRV